ncbi:glutamine amidotransferase-related protein [Parvularcula lutaonensis]|uniref:Glutamine amidotransferase domain-containing protein n=1 Tax=Parvularcula lutaonensis TaxID=491923 RepID=A0ABV7MES1_9PROT|nr:hypothetical protein [Parvularcula lutaonensis]GGY50478.1 GMP synthase [Parvularcula lutaonensis]
MKLVIAETGHPPAELPQRWPSYPLMFETMFAEAGASFETETVDVTTGKRVPPPEKGAALLVTGSPAGAYEPHEFIAPLEDSIRSWAAAHRPVIGICFGHQLIAQAFGAKVEKSPAGWGVGVHTYEVLETPPWADSPARFSCAVSHQDQVVSLPQGMRRIAGSPFCPNGVLQHEALPVLTFQMHPEFRHDYASALLGLRSDRIPKDRVAFGQASLRNGSDRGDIALWIKSFVEERL